MGDTQHKIYVTQHTKMLKDGTVKTYTVNQKYKVKGYPRKDGTRAAKMEFSTEQIAEMRRLDKMDVKRKTIMRDFGITHVRLKELLREGDKGVEDGVD